MDMQDRHNIPDGLDGQDRILLEDETLRDGLQSENRIFPLEDKLRIYNMLADAGVPRIQVGSFVHPQYVPQMADTDEFIAEINRQHRENDTPLITGLILNGRGMERALKCSLKHVSMSVSVSNSHSLKNAKKSAADALKEMSRLITEACAAGLTVRSGLQCAFGCVYEGTIATKAVLSATEALVKAGASEINLADSTGMANPLSVGSLVEQVKAEFPDLALSLHLHDTRGLGLANMFAGYLAGIRTFDVCAGGLGGCPFIRGASGNVSTEDAVHMFSEMGVHTGIDINAVCATVRELEIQLDRHLPGKMCSILASGVGSCGAS